MNNTKEFILADYLASLNEVSVNPIFIDTSKDKYSKFLDICAGVKLHFDSEWEVDQTKKEQFETLLERQKRAIIGHPIEVNYYKGKIAEYLTKYELTKAWFPSWFESLSEAIFAEVWGFSSLTAWLNNDFIEFKNSSSAKIIGDRIYFMLGGKLVLQPQTISKERRIQLRKALLLKTPKVRISDDYHEVYTQNGTRITIFGEGKTKEGQDTFVFRKFFVKDYSFKKQAELGTIPDYAINLFEVWAKVGFNVAFIGAVRSSKTTQLTTWQSYENPDLEGIVVETDPEIPFHEIMPTAPITQMVADGDELEKIVKSILRADPDYVIMAEARDATAFKIALEVTDRGTRRSKMTAHFTKAIDFPYNVAKIITEKYKGDLYTTITKVAQNFNYIFEYVQLPDKSKKRLKGIFELRFDSLTQKVTIHQICKYRFKTDDWVWRFDLGEDTKALAEEESPHLVDIFELALFDVALSHPMDESEITVFEPSYTHLRG